MASSQTPPKDLALTNLAVQDSLVARNITAVSIVASSILQPQIPISFTPSADFVLTENNSVKSGDLVQLSLNGVLTGDLGTQSLVLGTIPASLAPRNAVGGPQFRPPFGIMIVFVEPDGTVTTHPSGFPFPIGSYDIGVNLLWMKS